MNLWRRSKSWFQEGSSIQKDAFEPSYYLQQEKELLVKKFEREKKLLEKQYQKQLAQVKLRFDMECRHLDEKHRRLKDKNRSNSGSDEKRVQGCNDSLLSLGKTDLESDGLEWDPSDELRSYSEDENGDSWDIQSDRSRSSSMSLSRETSDEIESCDSAYSSLSNFLNEGNTSVNGYQQSEVERKIEQLRLSIRQEVMKECDEKFRQEKNFLYSIIDELEENVSLLRKQKEDIVAILEKEAKRNSKQKSLECFKNE